MGPDMTISYDGHDTDPDCIYCDGTGYRENTLGNLDDCFCRWDKKYIAELAENRKQRELAALLEKEQMTDWDLL